MQENFIFGEKPRTCVMCLYNLNKGIIAYLKRSAEYIKITNSEIQNIELAMLKFFHAFCIKYELRYYISGGTLLGAVRHRGFIPWDDDIDVHMPRQDFNKLLSLQDELPDCLKIYFLGNPVGYPHPFGKLVNTRTVVIEPGISTLKLGIYIDIFPIDGVPKNNKVQMQIEKELLRLEKQLDYNYFIPNGYVPGKNSLICFFQKLRYGKTKDLSPQLYREKYNELLAYDFDNSSEVKNFTCYKRDPKEQVPRSFYGKPTLMQFADTEFFGFEKAALYLTHFYGDYMTLPPLNKRFSHKLEATYKTDWNLMKIAEELKYAFEKK